MKRFLILWIAVIGFGVGKAQSLYFPPTTGSSWATLMPQELNWCQPKIDSLYRYLEANNTKAFILLKDGKIVMEKYFGTHTQTSAWQWASAGKTLTAFMIGIAQQEKYLSINDVTSQHLGEGWTNCTPEQEKKITIRHQLTMTSGLNDGVADHYCTIDTCLIYRADAGSRWAYHNGPYTLLDKVMENATKTTLNTYTTQKLKNSTGITGIFYKIDYNNVYFSTARSMARFGLLMLNKGNWNGTQIMTDTTYFKLMVNSSQNLNPSYGFLWWLNGKASYMVPGSQIAFKGFLNPNAPADMYAAMGKDGQFINVVPSQNLVWIRMGEASESTAVPFLLNDKIWEYINTFACNATNEKTVQLPNNAVQIFTSGNNDLLHLVAQKPMSFVQIFTIEGKLVKSIKPRTSNPTLAINDLPNGFYLIKVSFGQGNMWQGRFVKK